MICELWVKGRAWTGQSDVEIDTLWKAGFSGSIPQITYAREAGNGTSMYQDGLGSAFGGTGWYAAPSYYLKNCVISDDRFDCLNGGCVPQDLYHTPGAFLNRAECEGRCAKNSDCSGECVEPSEIASLRQSVNNLQNRYCK